jgi:hypothetical protein
MATGILKTPMSIIMENKTNRSGGIFTPVGCDAEEPLVGKRFKTSNLLWKIRKLS